MRKNRIAAAAAAVILASVLVVGGASVSATGGSADDPLITLSYLTQVLTPQLMREADEQAAANRQALEANLNAAIDSRLQELAPSSGQGSSSPSGSASFQAITLQKGQTLRLGIGCELVLRSGAAVLAGGSSPGPADTTGGGFLESGEALIASHLYLATEADQQLAFSAQSELLIRGSYTY